MEENSEAHMDTGVSSTTEDVQEAPASSHHGVETVIVVESVKEEDMSPNKKAPDVMSSDKVVPLKPIKLPQQQEIAFKKIQIKSPSKDLQVLSVPRSTFKSQEPKTTGSTEAPKSSSSSPLKLESAGVSSNKPTKPESPRKTGEVGVQNAGVDSSVQQNKQGAPRVQPIKIILSRKSADSPGKPIAVKLTPDKTSSKEQQKDNLSQSDSAKASPDKPPIKITISKDSVVKNIPAKDFAVIPSVKTTLKTANEKQVSNKEILMQVAEQEKETKINEKQAPQMETQSLITGKQFPGKEAPTKGQAKEVDVDMATVPEKEQTNITTSVESKSTPGGSKPEEPIKNKNLSFIEDADASNDSQLETCSETSEKEHKSISRELRSLINSAKESKIISECTQLTSKTRKSRSAVDSANTSISSPAEPEKVQGIRRYSCNSQRSTSSDKSEKTRAKRSARSLNRDMTKAINVNTVSGKSGKDEEGSDGESQDIPSSEREFTPSLPKKKKANQNSQDSETDKGTLDKGPPEKGLHSDPYCWRCHWPVQPPEDEKQHPNISCSVCPRSFHYKCLTGTERNKVHTGKNCVCPECLAILQAESSESRSPAMKKISLGMLCDLLKYALERMMEVNGVEPFTRPVDRKAFPDYDKYVVHPMDLGLMKKQIDEGLYGSTEAFLADAQWIQHNSIIFNTLQAKLTAGARALVRSCRAEMGEIEACPECYAAAHARRPTWFTDVCSTPHILLWAKLKGFPYWPAKGMSINGQGLVDVRFFGAHDRAWVPAKDCFLYSEKDPNNFRTKRQDILDSMQEAEQHIRNISRKYGKFVYPPFKTQFDPTKLCEQIKLMIPSFEGEVRTPIKVKPPASCPGTPVRFKQRSNSKGSKASINEGDVSEGEESASVASVRKMADGGVIAKDDVDFSVEKDKEKSKPMEVDTQVTKENESPMTRKRRRSQLEEAVITIIDTGKEKRRRLSRAASAGPAVNRVPKTPTENKAQNENKDEDKTKNKDTPAKGKEADPKAKGAEPSTSTEDKKANPKVAPIVCHRVISIAKVMKTGKLSPTVSIIKPKDDDNTKNEEKGAVSKEENISKKEEDKQQNTKDETPSKKAKPDKSAEKEKATPQEDKKTKRRNSTKNKSLNSSTTKADKKNDKPAETKEKPKENTSKPDASKSNGSKKDGDPIDDDTSLAVLARVAKNNTATCLPTITSVRSLSNTQGSKSLEVTVEATSSSSIFTPTSTDNVRNMKEAMNKLQRLRSENEKQSPKAKQVSNEKQGTEKPSQVGKVGVRAFARITSPPEKEARQNDVQVEIKTEPVEYEETERQMKEKMEMMSQFKLRPVNPPAANLREVRINKVVVTPMARKGAGTQTPPQPPAQPTKAKKTFPQPKKPDEGRSELTCKNSMVYIPIQPPMTQAPIRGARPVGTPTPSTPPQPRAITPLNNTSIATNSTVNTLTSPQVNFSSPSSSATSSAVSTPVQGIPTVGQVPSTVHTMPLITSVNGQWTFSLQPVLSVGGVDNTSSPPIVNGIGERPPLLPIAGAGGVLVPTGLSPAPPALAIPPPAAGPSRNNSDNTPPREPPRLQQRPSLVNPLDANAPLGNIPPPSTVGPITAKLNQNAVKMTDFFRSLLEDSIEKIDEPSAQLTALKLQLEQSQWRHQQEIDEIKHNHELMLAEMRASFEKETQRMLTETRRLSQIELDNAVKSAKAKQWCANCNQEAQFYCCWNTSYCDYGCQRAHWATHYAVCTQPRSDGSNPESNAPERLQAAPENLPKTTAAPNMAISKLQPGRVYTQEQAPQGPKPSIIVSMVEDASGNQTMKCVGTFKPPGTGAPPNMSPLILNKQTAVMKEAGGGLVAAAQIVTQTSENSPTISKPQSKPTISTVPSAQHIVIPKSQIKPTISSTKSAETQVVIRKPTHLPNPSSLEQVTSKPQNKLTISTAPSPQHVVIPKSQNKPIISSTKSAAAKMVIRKPQDKHTHSAPSSTEKVTSKPQNKPSNTTQHLGIPKIQKKNIIPSVFSAAQIMTSKSQNKPTITSVPASLQLVMSKPSASATQKILTRETQGIPNVSSAPSAAQIKTSKTRPQRTISSHSSAVQIITPNTQNKPTFSLASQKSQIIPTISSTLSAGTIVTSKSQNKPTSSSASSTSQIVSRKSRMISNTRRLGILALLIGLGSTSYSSLLLYSLFLKNLDEENSNYEDDDDSEDDDDFMFFSSSSSSD